MGGNSLLLTVLFKKTRIAVVQVVVITVIIKVVAEASHSHKVSRRQHMVALRLWMLVCHTLQLVSAETTSAKKPGMFSQFRFSFS